MPKLVYHLKLVTPARAYDEYELAALQLAYDRARASLGVGDEDPRRERVAVLIFDLAELASGDELVDRVVAAFKHLT